MTELHDSELGCKDYWDKAYVKELENFQNNDEDHGKDPNSNFFSKLELFGSYLID